MFLLIVCNCKIIPSFSTTFPHEREISCDVGSKTRLLPGFLFVWSGNVVWTVNKSNPFPCKTWKVWFLKWSNIDICVGYNVFFAIERDRERDRERQRERETERERQSERERKREREKERERGKREREREEIIHEKLLLQYFFSEMSCFYRYLLCLISQEHVSLYKRVLVISPHLHFCPHVNLKKNVDKYTHPAYCSWLIDDILRWHMNVIYFQ